MPSQTLTVEVSADDGRVNESGQFSTTNEVFSVSTNYQFFAILRGLNTPQGWDIVDAELRFYADDRQFFGTPYSAELRFRLFDIDDAPVINDASDVTGASLTSAFFDANFQGRMAQSVNDFSQFTFSGQGLLNMLQQVVSRPDWSPGNDIVLHGIGRNSPDPSPNIIAFDNTQVTGLLSLYVEWQAPPNTAPEITDTPTVSYGSLTRLGPNNTPATVTFTATDDEDTGTDDLTWEIRTAASGGGTLVATGSCTSGVSENVNIAYNASGISEGSNTLYLSVNDGTVDSSDSQFTVLVDTSAPTVGAISTNPSPVTSNKQYSISFTASDTYSTDTNELSWELRTASGGGGTLLDSGTATSGVAVNTGTITDAGLAHGTNNRWLRILDGAGNVLDQSFTVTAELLNYFTATMVAEASMTAALTSTTAVEATMEAETSVTSALTSTTAVVATMAAEASVEAFLTSTTAVVAEMVAEAFVEAAVTNFVVSGWHRPPLHLEVMVGPHEVEVLSGSNAATAVTGANTIEVVVGPNRLTPEID